MKIKLTIRGDLFNNVGRRATYRNDGLGRTWQIKTPLYSNHFKRYYLIENVVTGQRRIVPVNDLGNMY